MTSKITAESRAYLDMYQFKGRFAYYPDPNWIAGPPYASEFNKIVDQALGGEVMLTGRWNTRHQTIFGGEYKKYQKLKFDYYSEHDPDKNLDERYNIKPDENIVSAYVLHTFQPTQKVMMEAGLHYDDYSTVGSHVSPRGSISFKPMERSWLKLLYGEAYRAPNFWESNTSGPIFFVEGNPDLKPEVVRNVELLVSSYPMRNMNLNASLFRYTLDDNIQVVEKWSNVKGLTGTGLELDTRFRHASFDGYANFTYSNVARDTDDERIALSPQWLAKAGLIRSFNDIAIGIESQMVGPRLKGLGNPADAPEGYEAELKAYNLTNITLSNIVLNKWLRLSFSVYNVLNTGYEHPSHIPDLATWNMNVQHPVYDIPADGRSFMVKTEFKF